MKRTTQWAIALHGGAGAISKEIEPQLRDEYLAGLNAALQVGMDALARGQSALDAVEWTVRALEDDPLFNAGKGAVLTHEGVAELDATIMDGRDGAGGGVTAIRTIKNPVTLARRIMEQTNHVLLCAEGAERFADTTDVERVDPAYFLTERRVAQLQQAIAKEHILMDHSATFDQDKHGTVGCVAMDLQGNLAAATSTGGMMNKKHGRVGDSAILGAGNYANNATCAVSGTGKGEEFIRHGVGLQLSTLMEHGKKSLPEAARIIIDEKLQPGQGGIIAIDHSGGIVMMFNTLGMFRAAANADGHHEVKIWE